MTKTRQIAKTLSALSAALIFEGCTVIREPLDMSMPKLYFIDGKCAGLTDNYEYGVCASEQIEALKTDRQILKTIVKGCVK